ncbi:MAG: hypothetical protein IPK16_16950 [Anaerolineales bacterium]|nr:hypothetical protein [Anaerolineales bacterium]
MNFFARFFNTIKGQAPSGSDRYLPIYVYSNRCREPIVGQLDMMNEISLADEGGYYGRKVLHTSGKQRCFSQVEVELWLDTKKRVTRYEVQGGRWLTAAEYAQALEEQNAEEVEASPAEDTSETESLPK